MTTLPEDLAGELRSLQDQMARLLDLTRQGGRSDAHEPGGWQPPVDIYEDTQAVVIEMELPGLEQQAIDVHIDEGSLVVQGERRREREGAEDACQRSERLYGPFRRTFLLPAGIDANAIQAKCTRGVLTVLLPKQPASGLRQIEVVTR